jgi:LmbE family N-acetylglucosaminyl deacetylase
MAAEFARLATEGRAWPLGGFPPCPRPDVPADAPRVLIFSPHPDDEVIIGGLALRLLRETRWNVVNVAVTLGSKRERQAERLSELRRCCECIGFGLVQTLPNGLENVNAKARERDPARWAQSVEIIADLLLEQRPRAIFFPHEHDWNSTHIGTHLLVMDALRTLPAHFATRLLETEFWGQMASPNVLVEISARDLGDLITALTFHAGEVRRNPYHLSLPAWMMDNVRRGAEVVGGQGGTAPPGVFGSLYRLREWNAGRVHDVLTVGRLLTTSESAAALFEPVAR